MGFPNCSETGGERKRGRALSKEDVCTMPSVFLAVSRFLRRNVREVVLPLSDT